MRELNLQRQECEKPTKGNNVQGEYLLGVCGEVHMEMPEGAGLHVEQTISISQSVCFCDPPPSLISPQQELIFLQVNSKTNISF